MDKQNKLGIFFGVLFELAAVYFLTALMLQFFVPAENQSLVFNIGVILYSVYGYSSLVIPVLMCAAGVILLCGKASLRWAIYFLCSIFPFITICLSEKAAKFIYTTDGTVFAGIKAGAALVICALLVAIEYILIGMLADFIITAAAKREIQRKKEDEEEIITAFTPRAPEKTTEESYTEDITPKAEEETFTTEKESENAGESNKEERSGFQIPKYIPYGEQIAKKTANWKNYASVGDYIRKNITGEVKTETPAVEQQNEPVYITFQQMMVPDMKLSEIKETKEPEEITANDTAFEEPSGEPENENANNYFVIKNFTEEESAADETNVDKPISDDLISKDEAAFLSDPFGDSYDEAFDKPFDESDEILFDSAQTNTASPVQDHNIDVYTAESDEQPEEALNSTKSESEPAIQESHIPDFPATPAINQHEVISANEFEAITAHDGSTIPQTENSEETEFSLKAPEFFEDEEIPQTLEMSDEDSADEDLQDDYYTDETQYDDEVPFSINDETEEQIPSILPEEKAADETETAAEADETDTVYDETDEQEISVKLPEAEDNEDETTPETNIAPTTKYQIPTENILRSYPDGQYWIIDAETQHAAELLKETLSEFKIEADVTGIRKGPVVTMFEILPAPGVKLNKIVALQDNIALRLAASSVRIVAPIPGKHAVGIEVPNKQRAIVSFKEIIESNSESFSKMQIPVILGKDITGGAQIIDLAATPHLLIAGSTGSGKSVCVNTMILSILYKRSPDQVKLILIDPKIVELKLYNDIPHLLTPVITEPKKAFQALQYCLCEMERRYALLDHMGVRDIKSYNKRIEERNFCNEKLPYIVIVIDEFADLMATTGKELESTVARLAAMSRAVGIHIVLATQRPSIDVITGLIKANIPSRIAFMVASKMDSRIIIDQVGAEKLLGKGDMLYASAVDPFPVRIQGTFVSEDEVENVVECVKQFGEPEYIDEEIFFDEEEEESEPTLFTDGEDPLYEKALDIVIQAGKASASYIQRRLKIGYNRAARLVEEMEERGIVGPANGSKPRDIIHMPSRPLQSVTSDVEV